jgi:signal peptide peptidase SppA
MTSKFSIVDAIKKEPWAITESGLALVLAVASRDVQALSKYEDAKLGTSHKTTIRNGIAIIPVHGPIVKGGSNFRDVSAATSYASIMADFQSALESEEVHSILFEIDSPGGQALGNSELSDYIYENRSRKKIYSYVSGYGCSAAYWISSATSKIFANKNAILGSIGCMCVVNNQKNPDEVRFLSSISPHKNADADSDSGKTEIQNLIDTLGSDFAESVAKNRGITLDQVLKNYGQGKTFIGTEAFKSGLCDEISTFEKTLLTIQKEHEMAITIESVQKDHPEIANHFIGLGKTESLKGIEAAKEAERERISGILTMSKFPNSSAIISKAITNPEASKESIAMEILEATPEKKTSTKNSKETFLKNMKKTEEEMDAPENTGDDHEGGESLTDEQQIKAKMKIINSEGEF